jgi:hypothetical protein
MREIEEEVCVILCIPHICEDSRLSFLYKKKFCQFNGGRKVMTGEKMLYITV